MRVSSDLTLCGWRVRTELPLPELLGWEGDDRDADVIITREPVANIDNDSMPLRSLGLLTCVCESGSWILNVPSVGKIRVRGGRHIEVCDSSSDDDIRAFVLGPALAVCCSQKKLLPLSASVVARDDRAIAIIGNTGVGKSAVALALTHLGYRLVSDGIAVLRESPEEPRFEALATYPFHSLWRRAVFSLDLSLESMGRTRPCLEKYSRPFTGSFNPAGATPLSDIVILRREPEEDGTAIAPGHVDQIIDNLMRCIAYDLKYDLDASMSAVSAVLRRLALSVRAHVVSISEDAEAAGLINGLLAP